jgi:hypothetical protein
MASGFCFMKITSNSVQISAIRSQNLHKSLLR